MLAILEPRSVKVRVGLPPLPFSSHTTLCRCKGRQSQTAANWGYGFMWAKPNLKKKKKKKKKKPGALHQLTKIKITICEIWLFWGSCPLPIISLLLQLSLVFIIKPFPYASVHSCYDWNVTCYDGPFLNSVRGQVRDGFGGESTGERKELFSCSFTCVQK